MEIDFSEEFIDRINNYCCLNNENPTHLIEKLFDEYITQPGEFMSIKENKNNIFLFAKWTTKEIINSIEDTKYMMDKKVVNDLEGQVTIKLYESVIEEMTPLFRG